MIKKFMFIFILNWIIIFLVSGCSISNNETYIYKGENQNWNVEYSIRFGPDNRDTAKRHLKISYKNDISELNKTKRLEYSYESSVASKKGTLEFDQPPNERIYTLNSSSNGAIERKDETIKVLITIDGKMELIELKFDADAKFDYLDFYMFFKFLI